MDQQGMTGNIILLAQGFILCTLYVNNPVLNGSATPLVIGMKQFLEEEGVDDGY